MELHPKQSTTYIVSISIDWNLPENRAAGKFYPEIIPSILGQSFSISSENEGKVKPLSTDEGVFQTWSWQISTEKTGNKLLSIAFKDAQNNTIPLIHLNRNAVTALTYDVDVLTELGMSSKQEAWIKAIGAILTVIISIAGLSLWKRKTEAQAPPGLVNATEENIEIILQELARHIQNRTIPISAISNSSNGSSNQKAIETNTTKLLEPPKKDDAQLLNLFDY